MKVLTILCGVMLLWNTTVAYADNELLGDGNPYYISVVYDPQQPPVLLEREFALEMVGVAECESTWDDSKVGKFGERGLLQVHPIHAKDMQKDGLSFYSGKDRLLFAEKLWKLRGWQDWSCWYAASKGDDN